MKPRPFSLLAVGLAAWLDHVAAGRLRGQSPTPERIVITDANPAPEAVARKTDLSDAPLASPSSVSVRTAEDFRRETITSYGDLLRPVAGVSVSNYDQGNLGYGITLRGFDEGNHGSELAYAVDGVPVNLLSSAVGFNGLANLAPLLPELAQDLAVFRGPFNPRFGNFALGGAVDIRTVARAPSAVSVVGGSFDYGRVLGVLGLPAGRLPVSGYTAFEADTLTGYRDNSDIKSVTSFTRLETPILRGAGTAGFRAQVYSTAYGAAGYLDRAAVERGARSDTDAANRYDGGSWTSLSFSTPVSIPSPDGDFFATLFVNRDLIKRWSDFRLDRDDDGTQRLQTDDRVAAGGLIEKSLRFDGLGGFVRVPGELTVGGQSRSDLVSQDIFDTVHRQPTARRGEFTFTQQNAGAFVRLQLQPVPWLKLSAGTRYDRFFYDASDRLTGQRIAPDFGAFTPKVGAAVSPLPGLSVFHNYGEGVRSPDAVADLLANPALRAARLRSVEAGFSYDTPPPPPVPPAAARDPKDQDKATAGPAAAPAPRGTFHLLADAFYTTLSNEVVTGPDGVTPQNFGRSRRRGVEVEANWQAVRGEALALGLFANYSYVEARLTTGPVNLYVPDVAAFHVNYGLDLDAPWLLDAGSPHRFHLSLYHQVIGPKHLTTDGALYTKTFTRLQAKLAYAHARRPGLGAFVGLVAYPDRRLEEVAFDFGDGQVGVSPKPRLNFQGGLSCQF